MDLDIKSACVEHMVLLDYIEQESQVHQKKRPIYLVI